MRGSLGLMVAAGAALAFVAPAQAQSVTPRMPIGRAAAAPAGYVQFCAARPVECGEPSGRAPSTLSSFWRDTFRYDGTSALADDDQPLETPSPQGHLPLTAATLELLNTINRDVNSAIAPAADRMDGRKADIWSLPLAEGRRSGDCEDYVLEKRRALLARGLPAQALAIAVVRTRHGESHAVLVVDTDAGELVLDNRLAAITPWTKVDYRWVKRQSPSDPSAWVRIGAL